MLRDRFCRAVFVITLVLSASAAHANNINVCASGGAPYTNIQDGVNAAAPGDSVLVCPGSYTENVSIATSGVRVVGHGTLGSVALTCTDTGNVGFFIQNSSNVELRNFDVSGCGQGIFVGGGLTTTDANLVVGNNIHDNTGGGIAAALATGTRIIGNTVRGSDGIGLNQTSGDHIQGNLLVGRGNEPFGTFGVVISFSKKVILSNNTIRSHSTGMELADTANSTVSDNNVPDCWYYGITLISFFFDPCPYCQASSGNTISNNTADSNGLSGIFADSSATGNLFKQNYAHRNGYNVSDAFPIVGDMRDDDTNTWRANFCDTAVGNATCVH